MSEKLNHRTVDLRGFKTSRLTVLEYAGLTYDGYASWKCSCKCGNIKIIRASSIKQGQPSCGCLQKELARAQTKHRKCGTKTYTSWCSMRSRCNKKTHTNYPDYGGRGITVCDRWNVFANFYEDMGDYPSDKSLDRKDNNKGYTPDNCRWATRKQQQRNMRSNVNITIDGETKTLQDWIDISGNSRYIIKRRLVNGWDHRRAVFDKPFTKK